MDGIIQASLLVPPTTATLINRHRQPTINSGTGLRGGPAPDRDRMMVQFTQPLFSGWGTSSFSTPIPSLPTRDFSTITNQPRISRSISMASTRERQTFSTARSTSTTTRLVRAATPPVTIPIIVNPFGTTPGVNPIAFNQFTAGASVTKTIRRGLRNYQGTAFYIAYDHADNNPAPFNTSHDGTSVWLSGRVGYHFTPGVYAFGEVDGIWQRFNNSIFDTNGYRVLGGIGTDDQNSLFRGEVYGGYQVQTSENSSRTASRSGFRSGIPKTPTAVSLVAVSITTQRRTGRLLHRSTRCWACRPSCRPSFRRERLTCRPLLSCRRLMDFRGSGRSAPASATRAATTKASTGWITGWMAGASFNYEIWRNLRLTLDYQYSTLHSNIAFNRFNANVVTAGLTYRY